MKILFLTHYREMYGANRSLLSLLQGLKGKGVELMIWCPKEGGFTEALKAEDLPYEVIPFQNWADTIFFPGYWLLPIRAVINRVLLPLLLQKARAFDPDCIHTNSSILPIGAVLADRLDRPHVWHIREFGRLDYNMRFFPGKSRLYYWLKKAAMVIVISKAVREVVIGNRNIPAALVYNGIVRKAELPNLSPEPRSSLRFLVIGMIHPNKNQLEALQAFSQLTPAFPEARMLIVGSGRKTYLQQLKAFTKANQMINQVSFSGYISDPKTAYQQADVVLMCSKYEAMGRVTVEAMAYGKPVIGLDSGATPELIEHGLDGFLYRKGPDELAQYMQIFLEDPAKVLEMGMRGQEKVRKNFLIEDYVQQMYKIFREVSQG